MWLCGYVIMWLCSYVAIWLCGSVAMWLCFKIPNFRMQKFRKSKITRLYIKRYQVSSKVSKFPSSAVSKTSKSPNHKVSKFQSFEIPQFQSSKVQILNFEGSPTTTLFINSKSPELAAQLLNSEKGNTQLPQLSRFEIIRFPKKLGRTWFYIFLYFLKYFCTK